MAKEKNLTAVTSVAAADFARVVTSAGASVKATFANVAKYIIETYNGSTVAGSAQSVKSALDSLNSKTSINVNLSSVGDTNFTLASNRSGVKNGIYILDFTLSAKQSISSTSEMNIGTVSSSPNLSLGSMVVRSNDTKLVGAVLVSNNGSMYLRLTEPLSANQIILVSMCGY